MESRSEEELYDAMRDLYRQWKDDCKYNATRFIGILEPGRAVDIAGKLVMSSSPSKGFLTLHAYGRLALTVEALILRPEYQHLFPERVLVAARKRLTDFGFEHRDLA